MTSTRKKDIQFGERDILADDEFDPHMEKRELLFL